jgi:hypothetical protein
MKILEAFKNKDSVQGNGDTNFPDRYRRTAVKYCPFKLSLDS